MAHKKGQGSTKNGRDSNPQFRGIKLYPTYAHFDPRDELASMLRADEA